VYGTERQNIFSNISKKVYLLFYFEMKHESGKMSYTDECTRKDRIGTTWLKAGIWKLRGLRRELERGRYPLCLGEEDATHILLKRPQTLKWREELVCSKWLKINEVIVYNKVITCTNVAKIETTGKYSLKTKCKWETKVS
jgi:hypothetical protein